jgi:hypothetical protein
VQEKQALGMPHRSDREGERGKKSGEGGDHSSTILDGMIFCWIQRMHAGLGTLEKYCPVLTVLKEQSCCAAMTYGQLPLAII